MNVETSALKSAHAAALEELRHKLSAAEEKAREVERLEIELIAMKREKEETASRISELEIEVLEARDVVEEAEDAKAKAESRAKALEDNFSKMKVASESVLEDKKKEFLAQLDKAKKDHEALAAELQQEQDELLSQIAALEGELAIVQAALEKANQEQHSVVEEHAARLQNLEESNQLALNELNDELRRIRKELEVGQDPSASVWRVLTINSESRRDPRCQGQCHQGGTRTAVAGGVPGGQCEFSRFTQSSLI